MRTTCIFSRNDSKYCFLVLLNAHHFSIGTTHRLLSLPYDTHLFLLLPIGYLIFFLLLPFKTPCSRRDATARGFPCTRTPANPPPFLQHVHTTSSPSTHHPNYTSTMCYLRTGRIYMPHTAIPGPVPSALVPSAETALFVARSGSGTRTRGLSLSHAPLPFDSRFRHASKHTPLPRRHHFTNHARHVPDMPPPTQQQQQKEWAACRNKTHQTRNAAFCQPFQECFFFSPNIQDPAQPSCPRNV